MRLRLMNAQCEKIVGHLSKVSQEKKMAILVHGFAADKDSNFFPSLGKYLNSRGINVFRFDFSGSGESGGSFENCYRDKQLSELKLVIDNFEGYRIGLIGHSRGAMHSIIYSAIDRRVEYLVSIASRFNPIQRFSLIEEADAPITYRDRWLITPGLIKDLKSCDVRPSVRNLKIPKLFVHGKRDRTTSHLESVNLYKEAPEPKELALIEGATHNFVKPEAQKELFRIISGWILSLDR